MQNTDLYLLPRTQITENTDNLHLLEVEGTCPLCGKFLIKKKSTRVNKLYQIAHIYPNKPTTDQVKELSGLERLGDDCEDFLNKIALCKQCHGYYDDHTTKEEYLRLIEIKKKLSIKMNTKSTISNHDIESEIELVIQALPGLSSSSINGLKLEYNALLISKKIEDQLLLIKVENYVCLYFKYIKEFFRTLESEDKINFTLISTEIKTVFLKSEKEFGSKTAIYNSLSQWLQTKTNNSSIEACEIIIAYFIQNCEVFHEIAK